MSSEQKDRKPELYRFARFVAGENGILVEMFDHYHKRLFAYCLRLVKDNARAEDLMQDLWERVCRFLLEGKELSQDPLSLLWTMTRNICLDELKSARQHLSLDEISEESHPTSASHEPSRLEEVVVLALSRLPVAQRKVLELHTYSGYRFEEISEMLKEPVGAIKTRAWRARINLRKIVSDIVGTEDLRMQRLDPNAVDRHLPSPPSESGSS